VPGRGPGAPAGAEVMRGEGGVGREEKEREKRESEKRFRFFLLQVPPEFFVLFFRFICKSEKKSQFF
jgi:hypothetical protein